MSRNVRAAALLMIVLSSAALAQRGDGPPRGRRGGPASGSLRQEFVKELELFRGAVTLYREALSQDQRGIDKRVKEVQKHIGGLLSYLKTTDTKPDTFRSSEYADFSPKDLLWETLTVAERSDNDLHLALRLLDSAQRENAITVQALRFFRELQTDLVRLKWLTSKVMEQSK